MRTMRRTCLGVQLAVCVLVGDVFAKTVMLSAEKDTLRSEPAKAVRSSTEATAFWGMAVMLGGGKKVEPAKASSAAGALRSFSKKSGRFYAAAFLLSVKERDDVLKGFATSSTPSSTALAAASLAMRATGDCLEAEREKNAVKVKHFDGMGGEIAKKGRGKKGKGKKRKDDDTGSGGTGGRLPHLADLLSSKDPLTVYLALQAAAYSADASVSERVAELEPPNGKVAGAKLFYEAMIGGSLSKDAVTKAAEMAAKGMSRSRGARAPGPAYDLDLPGLCFVCKAIARSGMDEAAPVLSKAIASGDPRVQIDAARAIAALKAKACLPMLSKLIATAPWQVLIEACHAAGAVPDARMVPALIQRLGKEKGQMRLDLVHALSSIAGEQKGQDAGCSPRVSQTRTDVRGDPLPGCAGLARREECGSVRNQEQDCEAGRQGRGEDGCWRWACDDIAEGEGLGIRR